jgi:hypothetical protein
MVSRALLLLLLAAACAPSTISPMVIRMGPSPDRKVSTLVGVRTGPRLTVPVSTTSSSPFGGFGGDLTPFAPPQMGMAYDLGVTVPLTASSAVVLGGSGELYYPFPLPAYGLYAGYSHYLSAGPIGIAPSAVVRGATDIGFSVGGPGSMVGAEGSVCLSYQPEPKISLGLVPFIGVHQFWSGPLSERNYYAGWAIAVRVQNNTDVVEISGGFGRVFSQARPSWAVPIIGVRAGR